METLLCVVLVLRSIIQLAMNCRFDLDQRHHGENDMSDRRLCLLCIQLTSKDFSLNAEDKRRVDRERQN